MLEYIEDISFDTSIISSRVVELIGVLKVDGKWYNFMVRNEGSNLNGMHIRIEDIDTMLYGKLTEELQLFLRNDRYSGLLTPFSRKITPFTIKYYDVTAKEELLQECSLLDKNYIPGSILYGYKSIGGGYYDAKSYHIFQSKAFEGPLVGLDQAAKELQFDNHLNDRIVSIWGGNGKALYTLSKFGASDLVLYDKLGHLNDAQQLFSHTYASDVLEEKLSLRVGSPWYCKDELNEDKPPTTYHIGGGNFGNGGYIEKLSKICTPEDTVILEIFHVPKYAPDSLEYKRRIKKTIGHYSSPQERAILERKMKAFGIDPGYLSKPGGGSSPYHRTLAELTNDYKIRLRTQLNATKEVLPRGAELFGIQPITKKSGTVMTFVESQRFHIGGYSYIPKITLFQSVIDRFSGISERTNSLDYSFESAILDSDFEIQDMYQYSYRNLSIVVLKKRI